MLTTYLGALALILGMGFVAWLFSLTRRDVSIVDSLWSLMFLAAALLYAWQSPEPGARSALVGGLVAIWALRLSIHLTVRNWGEPEDRRYREIRRNNDPGFEWKSLYIVFGLQGVLAWIISIPLLVALTSGGSFHWLDVAATLLWLAGFGFQAIADHQLLSFRRADDSHRRVLDSGIWRYSRHPNYFGEFCIWWAYYLFALAAGGWWTIYAPVLMTVLLLRVSGVMLMEKGITSRRPGYRQYVERTNAFFPGRPKSKSDLQAAELTR